MSSLDDDKAEDIVAIDLIGKTSLADHMVIATGRSSRQVSALCHKLVDRVKAAGFDRPLVEGDSTADWIIVDTGDVIVHLFRPEVRDFYNLEKLWAMEPADEASSSLAH
ncbi:MAG: ribosome silencing factor [Alphaproteobacteria bacterium]